VKLWFFVDNNIHREPQKNVALCFWL